MRPGNTPEEIGRPISITFQIVVRKFSEEERIGIIEMLWEMVYADGVVSEFEANVMWRLGDLLCVSDRERIALRERVAGALQG